MSKNQEWAFNLRQEMKLEWIVQDVVNLIPSQTVGAGIASVRLVLEGQTFTSEAFAVTSLSHMGNIMLDGEAVGTLELFCMESPTTLRADFPPNADQLAAFSNWFSRLLLWRRRETAALEALEESLAFARKLLGSQHEEAQALARQVNDIFVLRSLGVSPQGTLN